jgi:hypothetical protein
MRHYKSHCVFALILATLTLGLLSSTAAAQTYFYNRTDFPTGNYPVGVALGDFNGDGRLDLAVTNFSDNTVSILLGKPDGTFAAKTDIPVTAGPGRVAVGDFNGDGKLDLAILNGSDTVSILLGNGDGTFQTHVDYPTGHLPSSLVVADFNHDGKADLAVTNGLCEPTCGPGTVSVLLGNGDGTFKPKTDYATPTAPGGVISADFNGDGNLDLALTGESATSSGYFVSILLGNGDGTFQTHVDYPTDVYTSAIAAADFNKDGKLDLVVAADLSIDLLLGNGDGTFQASKQIPTEPTAGFYLISAADLNHDGKMDFVVANDFQNGVSVFLGNGDGTFQPQVDYMANPGQGAMATGDVNGDGALDVVLTNWTAKTATVLLGNGDGTFSPRVQLPALPPINSTNWIAEGALMADFNGDGKLDLLVSEDNQAYTPNEVAAVFFPGNGDGTLGTPVLNDLAGGVLATADFNGDGKLDLLLSTTEGLGVAFGNGDGTFGSVSQVVTFEAPNVRGAVTGDFNNDGKMDFAVSLNGSPTNAPIILFLGNGDGTFRSVPLTSNSNQIAFSIVAADFNHDGKLDLAVAWDFDTSNLAVYLGNGDGTFRSPVVYTVEGLYMGMAVADLNGDSIPDLVVTTTNVVDVFLGNGDGTFRAPVSYPAGSSPFYVATGDFNGDGKVDLAVLDTSYLSILLGNGDGTFQPPVSVNDNSYLYSPAAGDLNQDGVTDLYTGFGTGSLFLSRPLISLFPAAINFGAQPVGMESPSSDLTLTNVGLGGLSVAKVVASADFQANSQCGSEVKRGANCTIGVTFTPTAPGAVQGTLTLTDNTVMGAQVIPLAGVGTVPGASLSPSSLTFSGQLISTPSSAQTVTLTNPGTGALAVDSITVTGDFADTDTCGSTVEAGGNCTISVTFTPTAGGSRTGTLTISDNAAGSPQTVKLTGTGQDFTLGMASGSSSTVSVAPGQTATYSLNVHGLGGFSQAISLSCTGAPSAANCALNPSSVTPSASGAASTITVTVATTAPSMAVRPQRWMPPFGLDRVVPILLVGVMILAVLAIGLGRQPLRNGLQFGLAIGLLYIRA